MDSDELDQWLDGGDEHGTGGDHHGWRATEADGRPGGRDRPRWLLPALVAGIVWVIAASFLLTGRADGDQVAEDDDGGLDPVLMGLDDGDPPPDPGGAIETTDDDLSPGAVIAAGDDDGVADPRDIAGDARADGGINANVRFGAAVGALRERLTGTVEGRSSYLELATPIGIQALQDRSLGAEVAVVLIDAFWLEGEDGRLTTALQGRWAIPVTADGTVLARPWQVPGTVMTDPPLQEPPAGTLRLDEVAQALEAAGWREVLAHGTEDHPLVSGILVALVDGTPPTGAPTVGDIVWLIDQFEGLVLLGHGS
ncbi:hypothetical protein BH23ACT9_BH23ACT9_23440 [soil metagenome]